MRRIVVLVALLAAMGCQDKKQTALPTPSPTGTCVAIAGDRCTAKGEFGPWDAASLSADGRTLTLSFFGSCGASDNVYRADTTATATEVRIGVYGYRPYSNLCAGTATVHVPLAAPLGRRVVRDDFNGKAHSVTRLHRVAIGRGAIDVDVPPTWSHLSGHIDLHYHQVFEVFSTAVLPPSCRSTGPGASECGVRLDALGPGDAALVIGSGKGLPGSSYKALKGTPVILTDRNSKDLGEQPCAKLLSCHSYAIPIANDDWFELELVFGRSYPKAAEVSSQVLDGVRRVHL